MITCWNCKDEFAPEETTWVQSAFEGEMCLAYVCPKCKHPQYGVEVRLTPHVSDGGYASPENLYVIGGCREHGFIVPRPPLVI